MVFDSSRGQTILFGGVNADGYFHDTWAWNGGHWRLLTQTGPSGRSEPSMAYDSRRHRIVLFGGYVQGVFASDTWEWDGKGWTQKSGASPSARVGCACAYDPRHRKVILFGGTTQSNTAGSTGETWGWNGSRWTLLTSVGPDPRMYAHMAYDSKRRQMILFGGSTDSGKLLGDTWTWNGHVWKRMPFGDAQPRAEQAMVFHGGLKEVVMFGGVGTPEPAPDSGKSLTDYSAWNGTRWVSLTTTTEPPACRAPMMAYDSKCRRLTLFGGEGHNRTRDFLRETWVSTSR